MKEFKINLENFSGPLDKILELIDKNKLEINQISLSKVTDDFLLYLEDFKKKYGQNEEFYEILADFISVAVKLLLIKAKSLLPFLEDAKEEEEEYDLEDRLRIYKVFKNLSLKIKELLELNRFLFKREILADRNKIFFSPGKLNKNDLFLAVNNLLKERDQLKQELKKVKLKEKIVSLEETMNSVYLFIKKVKQTNFNMLSQNKEKIEIITIFTSLLHLLKKGNIEIEQKEPFSEIKIKLLK